MKKSKLKERTDERFWAQVQLPTSTDLDTECWEWIGKIYNGYGRFSSKNTSAAHQYMYLLGHANIPLDMEINHTCWNRSCVNPTHLELLTIAQHRSLGRQPFLYPERVCPQCSESYDPKSGHQKYCSDKCRHDSWLIKQRS